MSASRYGKDGCLRKVLEQTVCRIDVRIEFLQQEQAGAGGDASYKDGGVHQYLDVYKRQVHDGKMQGAKTVEEQKAVIDRVFADQRGLIENYVDKDVTKVPQVFIPYKEVLDIYHAGLQVPDDVTLMWCDDNYGYIRHFPTAEECERKGGNGVYYHVSYWGRPHDQLWLGTMSPYLIFQQMKLAYDQGIQKMWILNVGDIKPAEYQDVYKRQVYRRSMFLHSGILPGR